jgi:hypothetical protein
MWEDLVSGLGSAATAAGEAVSTAGSFVFDISTNVMDEVFDGVSSMFESGSVVGGATSSAMESLGNVAGATVTDAAGNVISGGADSAMDAIWGGAKGALGGVWDFAKSAEGKQILGSGAALAYKERLANQQRKKTKEDQIEVNAADKRFQGAYYV